ncbi:hypothetical protein SAMN05421810_103548 [Amycolatopsis arida]|uniref:Transglycosylase associated protein n=1 Tax=Amycolatopsis arida TaxID=587909 RepID=A0A1I5TLC6_9PSEU|nr:GlsB/YeaQ/YmgE family stress response membrane protein [Amycolatopsis arida]TDX96074.1 hypothetical protein CLV69_103209 [Amycolatopsis arida]SFP83136.1 hypothetical protein SAMN05421810_103548 [Amycolatopsis arida]
MLGGIWGIITAIVVGLILGVIGRLLAPGDQKIPLWLTIVVGVIAAFIGNWLAGVVGVEDTPGIDWWRHAFQVGAAVLGVLAAAAVYPKVAGGRSASRT